MPDIEFVADFYGSFSVDEFAERLGISTVDLMECVDDFIYQNIDTLKEEMGINDDDEDDEE